eukprot:scaffold100188_cov18-Tisochrysis_lutea.AAC.1
MLGHTDLHGKSVHATVMLQQGKVRLRGQPPLCLKNEVKIALIDLCKPVASDLPSAAAEVLLLLVPAPAGADVLVDAYEVDGPAAAAAASAFLRSLPNRASR